MLPKPLAKILTPLKFLNRIIKAVSELLDSVRNVMRVRHYSYQTEKTYIHWIRQYIFFHKVTHPKEMGAAEVEAFLTHRSDFRPTHFITAKQTAQHKIR